MTDPASAGAAGRPDAEAEVQAANRRFYDAFEARDLDAMSDVWEHSDRVACTHPGWRTLRGWGAVSARGSPCSAARSTLQFILTDEAVEVAGDVAWVTVDENLLDAEAAAPSPPSTSSSARRGGWRLVAHHGSPVAPQPGPVVE